LPDLLFFSRFVYIVNLTCCKVIFGVWIRTCLQEAPY